MTNEYLLYAYFPCYGGRTETPDDSILPPWYSPLFRTHCLPVYLAVKRLAIPDLLLLNCQYSVIELKECGTKKILCVLGLNTSHKQEDIHKISLTNRIMSSYFGASFMKSTHSLFFLRECSTDFQKTSCRSHSLPMEGWVPNPRPPEFLCQQSFSKNFIKEDKNIKSNTDSRQNPGLVCIFCDSQQ